MKDQGPWSLPEAPIFRPTKEEFSDPIKYIRSIRQQAEPFGICKVVPPPGWKPPFSLETKRFRFGARLQKLSEIEGRTRCRRIFRERLGMFLFRIGKPMTSSPVVDNREIDLFDLFRLIQDRGGFDTVCNQRLWANVAITMGLKSNHGRALRDVYEQLLFEYELSRRINEEESKLVQQKQTEREEQLRQSALAKADVGSVAPSPPRPTLAERRPLGAGSPSSQGTPSQSASPGAIAPHHTQVKMEGSARAALGHRRKDPTMTQKVQAATAAAVLTSIASGYFHGDVPEFLLRADGAPGGADAPEAAKVEEAPLPEKFVEEVDRVVCEVCGDGHNEDRILLCDSCNSGFHYDTCLDPPLAAVPDGQWFCEACLARSENQDDEYGFVQGRRLYSLNSFKKEADRFQCRHFGVRTTREVKLDAIEREYWRLVEDPRHEISVEYGADLPSQKHGSGFPTRRDDDSASSYVNSGWNLQNLPQRSLLRFVDSDICGVIVPWLYVGMCFSTFCWHNEDHYTYSISYNHMGAPKQWYGVPGSAAEKFEGVMRRLVPELFEEDPQLLFRLVTMLNPYDLFREGIPIYRIVHAENEFVVTFPQSYHTGFNYGFNFAEACNFATPDWLPKGRAAAERYVKHRRKQVFSTEKLAWLVAISCRTYPVAAFAYDELRNCEQRFLRHSAELLAAGAQRGEPLNDDLFRRLKKPNGKTYSDDERTECCVSRDMFYLACCRCSACGKIASLPFALQMCECNVDARRIHERVSAKEIAGTLENVYQVCTAPQRWEDEVARLVDEGATVQRWEALASQVQRLEMDDDVKSLGFVMDTIATARQWQRRAAAIQPARLAARRRQGERDDAPTMDDMRALVEEAEGLPVHLAEVGTLRARIAEIEAWQRDARAAIGTGSTPVPTPAGDDTSGADGVPVLAAALDTAVQAADVDALKEHVRSLKALRSKGLALSAQIPEMSAVHARLRLAQWALEAASMLNGRLRPAQLQTLFEAAKQHGEVAVASVLYKQLRRALEDCKQVAMSVHDVLDTRGGCSIEEAERALDAAKTRSADISEVRQLEAALRRANEWMTAVDRALGYTSDGAAVLPPGAPAPTTSRRSSAGARTRSDSDTSGAAAVTTIEQALALRVRGGTVPFIMPQTERLVTAINEADAWRTQALRLLGLLDGIESLLAERTQRILQGRAGMSGTTGKDHFCLCNESQSKGQFMIACDRCRAWFHGRCVNIAAEEAEALSGADYLCPICCRARGMRYPRAGRLLRRTQPASPGDLRAHARAAERLALHAAEAAWLYEAADAADAWETAAASALGRFRNELAVAARRLRNAAPATSGSVLERGRNGQEPGALPDANDVDMPDATEAHSLQVRSGPDAAERRIPPRVCKELLPATFTLPPLAAYVDRLETSEVAALRAAEDAAVKLLPSGSSVVPHAQELLHSLRADAEPLAKEEAQLPSAEWPADDASKPSADKCETTASGSRISAQEAADTEMETAVGSEADSSLARVPVTATAESATEMVSALLAAQVCGSGEPTALARDVVDAAVASALHTLGDSCVSQNPEPPPVRSLEMAAGGGPAGGASAHLTAAAELSVPHTIVSCAEKSGTERARVELVLTAAPAPAGFRAQLEAASVDGLAAWASARAPSPAERGVLDVLAAAPKVRCATPHREAVRALAWAIRVREILCGGGGRDKPHDMASILSQGRRVIALPDAEVEPCGSADPRLFAIAALPRLELAGLLVQRFAMRIAELLDAEEDEDQEATAAAKDNKAASRSVSKTANEQTGKRKKKSDSAAEYARHATDVGREDAAASDGAAASLRAAQRYARHLAMKRTIGRLPLPVPLVEHLDEALQLYCACEIPYEENVFMLGCDCCSGWFHPRCIGVPDIVREHPPSGAFLCPSCARVRGVAYKPQFKAATAVVEAAEKKRRAEEEKQRAAAEAARKREEAREKAAARRAQKKLASPREKGTPSGANSTMTSSRTPAASPVAPGDQTGAPPCSNSQAATPGAADKDRLSPPPQLKAEKRAAEDNGDTGQAHKRARGTPGSAKRSGKSSGKRSTAARRSSGGAGGSASKRRRGADSAAAAQNDEQGAGHDDDANDIGTDSALPKYPVSPSSPNQAERDASSQSPSSPSPPPPPPPPCVLCGTNEGENIEGDLVGPIGGPRRGQSPVYVHRGCLILAGEVYEGENRELCNADKAIARAMRARCGHCRKSGAPAMCAHPKCQRSFHTRCAIAHGCGIDESFAIFCKHHRNRGEIPLLTEAQVVELCAGGAAVASSDEDDGPYCLCRRGQVGVMLECDSCHEWFHIECVGLPEQLAETDALERYECPNCCADYVALLRNAQGKYCADTGNLVGIDFDGISSLVTRARSIVPETEPSREETNDECRADSTASIAQATSVAEPGPREPQSTTTSNVTVGLLEEPCHSTGATVGASETHGATGQRDSQESNAENAEERELPVITGSAHENAPATTPSDAGVQHENDGSSAPAPTRRNADDILLSGAAVDERSGPQEPAREEVQNFPPSEGEDARPEDDVSVRGSPLRHPLPSDSPSRRETVPALPAAPLVEPLASPSPDAHPASEPPAQHGETVPGAAVSQPAEKGGEGSPGKTTVEQETPAEDANGQPSRVQLAMDYSNGQAVAQDAADRPRT